MRDAVDGGEEGAVGIALPSCLSSNLSCTAACRHRNAINLHIERCTDRASPSWDLLLGHRHNLLRTHLECPSQSFRTIVHLRLFTGRRPALQSSQGGHPPKLTYCDPNAALEFCKNQKTMYVIRVFKIRRDADLVVASSAAAIGEAAAVSSTLNRAYTPSQKLTRTIDVGTIILRICSQTDLLVPGTLPSSRLMSPLWPAPSCCEDRAMERLRDLKRQQEVRAPVVVMVTQRPGLNCVCLLPGSPGGGRGRWPWSGRMRGWSWSGRVRYH